MNCRHISLSFVAVLLCAGCPENKPKEPAPSAATQPPTKDPTDEAYQLMVRRNSIPAKKSIDFLNNEYQRLAGICKRTPLEIATFHNRLAQKTYDWEHSHEAIEGLCRNALER